MHRIEFAAATMDETVDSEFVPPQAAPPQVKPGDFLLSLASPWRHRFIRLGQALRIHGRDRARYIGWTHAALVVSADGGLIEAVGSGVRASHLSVYQKQGGPYQVVHIDASDEERARIAEFARQTLDNRVQYNRRAVLSIVLFLLTGCRFGFLIGSGFHCSGLVAHALEQTGVEFTLDALHIMPADLAKYFTAPPPPPPITRPAQSAFVRWALVTARG